MILIKLGLIAALAAGLMKWTNLNRDQILVSTMLGGIALMTVLDVIVGGF